MFGRLTHKGWTYYDTARRLSASAAGVSRSSTFVDVVQHRHRELLSTLDTKIDSAFEEKEQLNKKIGPATLQKFESLAQRCLNTEKVKLVPIGSLVYGLGYQQSDYDSVLFVKDKKERDAFMQIIHSNQDLRGALFESLSALIGRNSSKILNKEVSKVIPLTFLKIPLLVVEFTDGSSIDISIPDNDFQAIRNSNLVRYYLKADKRFGKMLLYIRRLFEECGVKNSKAGLLNNYHIVMTIVHFLQSEQSLTPWQVLPVLCQTHPSLVGRDLPIEQIIKQLAIPISNLTLDYQSNNKMNVSELLIRYFDYYSRFNFTKEAIHIEQGQARRMSRKSIGDEQRLMIIDPYSHGTVARSPYIVDAFKEVIRFVYGRIRNAMRVSFRQLPVAILYFVTLKFFVDVPLLFLQHSQLKVKRDYCFRISHSQPRRCVEANSSTFVPNATRFHDLGIKIATNESSPVNVEEMNVYDWIWAKWTISNLILMAIGFKIFQGCSLLYNGTITQNQVGVAFYLFTVEAAIYLISCRLLPPIPAPIVSQRSPFSVLFCGFSIHLSLYHFVVFLMSLFIVHRRVYGKC